MNEDIVIDVKNISKKYTIATEYEPDSLREKIVELSKYPLRVLKGDHKKPKTKEYWALKDVSFQVKRGEVLGIIGKNGAGKSTLLKILSRTTEPTSGSITMKGRVASLLEVGTGFNPELTGRENIYLNGAIIGMSKKEIDLKFNEIVEFAGIGEFLDTPVKRYSSGMYVRLAFAVAAHLDSDILILDEVLAVGDAEFQQKCLNTMYSLAKSGKTIIYVSHNTNSIKKMCSRVIYLKRGSLIINSEDIDIVISKYLGIYSITNQNFWENSHYLNTNNYFKPLYIGVKSSIKNNEGVLYKFENNLVEIRIDLMHNNPHLSIGYALFNSNNDCIYWSYLDDYDNKFKFLHKGRITMTSKLPDNILNIGKYRLELIGGIHNKEWLLEPNTGNPSIHFELRNKETKNKMWEHQRPTQIAPIIKWNTKYV